MLLGTVRQVDDNACRLELDHGDEVLALKVNVSAAGERSTLSLRPERIDINPPEGKYPNLFEGKVEERTYLGDHIRVRANVCGHDDFIVKVPNAPEQFVPKKGDTIKLGWTVEDCRALDAPQA
jgi:putative spermidine/putrescine transport system ATP-binding protein